VRFLPGKWERQQARPHLPKIGLPQKSGKIAGRQRWAWAHSPSIVVRRIRSVRAQNGSRPQAPSELQRSTTPRRRIRGVDRSRRGDEILVRGTLSPHLQSVILRCEPTGPRQRVARMRAR